MAGGVAHEINNPLMIILGNISILNKCIRDKDCESETVLKYLDTVKRSSKRIAAIVSGMDEISRDTSVDSIQNYTLHDIYTEATLNLKGRFSDSDLNLEIGEFPKDTEAKCQKAGVVQILFCILTNALEALEGSKENGFARIKTIVENDKVTILIENNGPLIEEKIRDRIFNPFFTTKYEKKAIGLGLSMAQKVAQNSKADLVLDQSCPLTTFKLELPKS
jgi:C4-dicarboxylate-specific signal transduction histidine kinase